MPRGRAVQGNEARGILAHPNEARFLHMCHYIVRSGTSHHPEDRDIHPRRKLSRSDPDPLRSSPLATSASEA